MNAELLTIVRSHRRTQDAYAVVVTEAEGVDANIDALRAGFDDSVERSAAEDEVVRKLAIAQRMMKRQRRLDATIRELYGLATRDELTGVFNRRYFFSEAERLLGQGAEISLVLFDLDGFKQVNDTYGHLSGDRILRDIGALFLTRTRNEDIIARYGGDEFVMLVTSAVKVAEMLAPWAKESARGGRLPPEDRAASLERVQPSGGQVPSTPIESKFSVKPVVFKLAWPHTGADANKASTTATAIREPKILDTGISSSMNAR